MSMIIPIDFVPGSHGHFLEITLNQYFKIVDNERTFTDIGTSHRKTTHYKENQMFVAKHWSEMYDLAYMSQFDKIISIRFTQDDLLLLSSVSLLRSGDLNISNDSLEHNTREKLNNQYYIELLNEIDNAYPFLDTTASSIPRNVLREFFKFGFKNPDINGYWIKMLEMKYPEHCKIFYFDFSSFYNKTRLIEQIDQLQNFLGIEGCLPNNFDERYKKFIGYIPYVTHKQICDSVIESIKNNNDVEIPKLSLFQESYINGNLENIFNKEMPFNQQEYFTSTGDVLYYLQHLAPKL